ncbi:hypothetical protein UJ101_00855 [Flavobacteriaceae bacterium UJ101]|nr:hypothetical protein UJ101_00855 [Flavobacteriaceae bacterium UJ101]
MEINDFIEASIKHGEASKEGDYKLANKNYDKLVSILKYLKENDSIFILKKFLIHEDLNVQLWAATFLLEENEEEAIKLMTKIANQNIPHYSFDAKITLEEWKKGNLKW